MNVLKPIFVAGSINMDLVVTAERIPLPGETVSGRSFATYPGGKGANQAVAIARLGYPVKLLGRIGPDGFGDELLNALRRHGVDTAAVQRVSGTSGVALITVAAEGQNSIVVVPGANAALTPDDIEGCTDDIRSAAVVLTQLEIPLECVRHLAEICHRQSVPLVLDPAPARDLPADLMRLVTWFTPNETEAAFYLEAAGVGSGATGSSAAVAHALRSLGPRNILLKLGSRGLHILTAEGVSESHSAFSVTAVDATAAGDCFNAAFAMYLATGHSPLQSARFASAAAALSVTRNGAQTSMPTLDEVDSLLAEIDRGQT